MLTHWRNLYRRLQDGNCIVTNPNPQISDESLRRSARLLAAITLLLLPLHLIVSIMLYRVYGANTWSWLLVLTGGVGTLIAYVLSRTLYLKIGINFFVAETALLALAIVYVSADSFSAVTSLLPIYFASLFRSLRRLVITEIFTIATVFAMSRLIPGDWKDIYGVLALMIVTSVVITIRSHLQWQAESELHQRNEQLAESEARFRAVIDASIGMFFLLKAVRSAEGQVEDFVLVDVNTQVMKQLQQAYSALINQPISAVIPAVYQQELFIQCKRVVNEGIPIVMEVQSAKTLWEYQAVPVGDGAAVIGFNITARKEAEQRQVELQIERERVTILQRFIRDISHDLMTPLSIIGSSSYLVGKSPAQDQRELHLHKIDEQTARLKGMFEAMLVQSRLDNLARQDMACKAVDLNQLLQKLVTSFANIGELKSQQLIFQPCPQAPITSIDRASMEIALGNIIDNSLKYTPEGGTITVSCQCEPENIHVKIEDNGSGVPVNEVALIFERFYRVEAHRPLTAGTGLGLSISKKIIELHGGSITAENRAEGGMRVCISLRKAYG